MAESKKKTKMISMRITQEQFDYLENFAAKIKKSTGFRITRASIIIKLIEYGIPHLEEEFPLDPKNRP